MKGTIFQRIMTKPRNSSLLQPDKFSYDYKSSRGLEKDLILEISQQKQEPAWMLNLRLEALKAFKELKLPKWSPDLNEIDFNDLYYYLLPLGKTLRSWEEVPADLRNVFQKLGIPKAEKEMLAGVGAQYDSEVIYESLRDDLASKGVIFMSMDQGLKMYPELVKEYFGSVVGPADNKFSALNSAVWSGGTFLYIPRDVHISQPLQVYFRMNYEKGGQFERSLIVVEEGSKLQFIEGCSAPAYSSNSLHAGVVEVVVKRGAQVQFTTIQNWYKNVYNLSTKRAIVGEEGLMRWIDGNLGSKLTMKYPACVLAGRKAKGEMLSISWAGEGQHQDVGAKMIHLAEETTSQIVSKSVCRNGGRNSYRGLVSIAKEANHARSKSSCDSIILDNRSRIDTYPRSRVYQSNAIVEHEAKVSRLEEEQVLYLASRGFSPNEAEKTIVNGFLEPVIKEIPMEYALEMNRLIELEMEDSIG